MKMGQTHVQRYLPLLLKKIEDGSIDPSFVISHRISLDEAPSAYELFREKKESCIKASCPFVFELSHFCHKNRWS